VYRFPDILRCWPCLTPGRSWVRQGQPPRTDGWFTPIHKVATSEHTSRNRQVNWRPRIQAAVQAINHSSGDGIDGQSASGYGLHGQGHAGVVGLAPGAQLLGVYPGDVGVFGSGDTGSTPNTVDVQSVSGSTGTGVHGTGKWGVEGSNSYSNGIGIVGRGFDSTGRGGMFVGGAARPINSHHAPVLGAGWRPVRGCPPSPVVLLRRNELEAPRLKGSMMEETADTAAQPRQPSPTSPASRAQ
jgi:hypothetical protein